jgi:sporulation protein YlmC with PRC-barrel domain
MTFEHDSKYEPNDVKARDVTLTGRTVVDNRAERVGRVTDVLFDGGSPNWAVVKTGLLSGEHFVPLEHTYVDVDGHLVVPLEKASVKRAPRAGRDHVITAQARHQLRDYYGAAASLTG